MHLTQALTHITTKVSPLFTQLDDRSLGECIAGKSPKQGVQDLLQSVTQGAPEAGAPYWRLRTWGLLTWQPLYLAMISAHCLKAIPTQLQHLTLKRQQNYTLGFQLPHANQWQPAQTEDHAVVAIGHQLQPLFQRYVDTLSELIRVRQPLLMAALADQVFATLERLAAYCELHEPMHEWVYRQGLAWCHTLGIRAPKSAQALQQQGSPYRRKTCCLVYRCHGAVECDNCPLTTPSQHAGSTHKNASV